MKLISFEKAGKASFGAVVGERIVDLGRHLEGRFATLRDLLAQCGLDLL